MMSKAPKPSKAIKPFTPIRRFFFKLELLGKRRRDQFHDYSNLDPIVDTPLHASNIDAHTANKENAASRSSPRPVDLPYKPVRVALQNEDTVENAVIITALDNAPFCCHEDLVTMSREKLVDVALALNAKLPAVLAIDVSHTRPTGFIQNSIEYIVGLRGDVPQAPKAVRLRSELDVNFLDNFDVEMNKSPPTSPLARRSRALDIYTSLGSPRLERLEEEEEELEQNYKLEARRPLKKRKVNNSEKKEDSDVEMGPESTPTPRARILRAHSQHVASTVAPNPMRVLRSHSLKLPGKPPLDTTFVTTRRPTYRYRSKTKAAKTRGKPGSRPSTPIQRSTPRKIRSLRPLSGYGPFLAPGEYQPTAGSVSADSSLSRMSIEDSPVSSTSAIGRKRKRSLDQTEDERAMACGIRQMNMGKSTSDMDITE